MKTLTIEELLNLLSSHKLTDFVRVFIEEEGMTSSIKSVHLVNGMVELSTGENSSESIYGKKA